MNSPIEQREVVARIIERLIARLRAQAEMFDPPHCDKLLREAADALSAIAKAEIHSLVGEGDEGSSQSQPCGDGAQPILPPTSEPSGAEDFRRRVAEVSLADSDLSYTAVNVLYERIPSKVTRREAAIAIRTLQAMLNDARAHSSPLPTEGEGSRDGLEPLPSAPVTL